MSQNNKVAVVTGSSTGIGFETALLLARSGFDTYATMRNLEKSGAIVEAARKGNLPIQVLQLDVIDDKSVKNAINRIANEKKRIDVVVNNAGYDLMGPVEDLSMDDIRAQFETNLFGVIRVMQAVLPVMRRQKSGTIVNVSSVGGKVAVPLNSVYNSTKFALEGLTEGMRYEVDQFGINLILVEPGVIRSNFLDNARLPTKTASADPAYASLMERATVTFKQMYEAGAGSPPEEVAKVILKAVTSDSPDVRYLAGSDAAMFLEKRKSSSDLEWENFLKGTIFAQPT
jgi:NAD(P)-dependent dehydrogenase (short-subunit alcohol dehydrogenase family)